MALFTKNKAYPARVEAQADFYSYTVGVSITHYSGVIIKKHFLSMRFDISANIAAFLRGISAQKMHITGYIGKAVQLVEQCACAAPFYLCKYLTFS